MKGTEMTFTPKSRAFTPKRKLLDVAHTRWASWCRSKGDSPTHFQRFLEDNGVHVDWHTASRWWHGETLPSTARIIELYSCGARGAFEAIFEPTLLFGNQQARARRIATMRAELEREENELRENGALFVGLDIREAGQSLDVDRAQGKAFGSLDNGPVQ